MKPLKLELRLRLERLMVELIQIRSMNKIYDLQDVAKKLQEDIEAWYTKCQDEAISGNGDEL